MFGSSVGLLFVGLSPGTKFARALRTLDPRLLLRDPLGDAVFEAFIVKAYVNVRWDVRLIT